MKLPVRTSKGSDSDVPEIKRAKGQKNTEQMIFRVTPAFSYEFRRYALDNGLKLNELLVKSFEAMKEKKAPE